MYIYIYIYVDMDISMYRYMYGTYTYIYIYIYIYIYRYRYRYRYTLFFLRVNKIQLLKIMTCLKYSFQEISKLVHVELKFTFCKVLSGFPYTLYIYFIYIYIYIFIDDQYMLLIIYMRYFRTRVTADC